MRQGGRHPLDREVIHILPQEYIVDDRAAMGMAGVRLEVESTS